MANVGQVVIEGYTFMKRIAGHQYGINDLEALILIWHGESLWNEKNLFTGCVDVLLSKKGIDEAIEAGKKISNIPSEVGVYAYTRDSLCQIDHPGKVEWRAYASMLLLKKKKVCENCSVNKKGRNIGQSLIVSSKIIEYLGNICSSVSDAMTGKGF
ncbi:hypothetical protein JHK85_037116 [Glycine max]|nr:hypothetical protein JHK85_037116 [Glycine max]